MPVWHPQSARPSATEGSYNDGGGYQPAFSLPKEAREDI